MSATSLSGTWQPIVAETTGRPALERPGQAVEHHRRDMRHARQDEDVADMDARRARHRVFDQPRAVRHPRHPQPRLAPRRRAGIMAFENRPRAFMHDDRQPERGGDRIGP